MNVAGNNEHRRRIRRFDLNALRGDIFGGIVSAVVALPLALAFGVASGLGPVAGLYGAIVDCPRVARHRRILAPTVTQTLARAARHPAPWNRVGSPVVSRSAGDWRGAHRIS